MAERGLSLNAKAAFNPTVLLAVALMAIIVMMILPMPAWVLDIGLAVSFALAILIFTITLFIERPLDFSAFPTILLASLMLRLSLNVSSTKLIIGQGHTGTQAAGDVINGFAQFVMGGSVFLGLVVFCVLLIVNFMVITKGATRMAEVGARFALDAMPGKQLAIDSDMSAGAISHQEAKERRELEQAETTFFGSLDGASKFVKGDAVAGLLITLLNLVAGLIMGTVVHGMPLSNAFETYAILTVGDGLVSQIPAVVISIASALLLAKGGAKGATDLAVFSQLGKHPSALATVAVLMVLFALVPGLPFAPFMAGGIGLGVAAFLMRRKINANAVQEPLVDNSAVLPAEKSLGDVLELDDIHVEFAPDLVNMVLDPGTGLDARIANMRTHVATVFGLILPEIRLTDHPGLPVGTYVLRIQGVEQARGELSGSDILALAPEEGTALPAGKDTTEPVYGAPARWINQQDQETAALSGITLVTPTEILATHLLEIVKRNFSRLLTLKSLRRLLQEMTNISDPTRAEANRKLLDELIPDTKVLRALESEAVPTARRSTSLPPRPETARVHMKLNSATSVEKMLPSSSEFVSEFAWDFRQQSPVASLSPQILPQRHEMPRNIAQQLAQAMNRNPERPLEIALNPAELGRVRMSLTPTDSGIVVNILAERAETLDLMRRNINDLGRSFADLGYEDIAFAFGQNSDPSGAPSEPYSDDADTLTLDLEEHGRDTAVHADTPALAVSAEGIDLRL